MCVCVCLTEEKPSILSFPNATLEATCLHCSDTRIPSLCVADIAMSTTLAALGQQSFVMIKCTAPFCLESVAVAYQHRSLSTAADKNRTGPRLIHYSLTIRLTVLLVKGALRLSRVAWWLNGLLHSCHATLGMSISRPRHRNNTKLHRSLPRDSGMIGGPVGHRDALGSPTASYNGHTRHEISLIRGINVM